MFVSLFVEPVSLARKLIMQATKFSDWWILTTGKDEKPRFGSEIKVNVDSGVWRLVTICVRSIREANLEEDSVLKVKLLFIKNINVDLHIS